jgi:molecular chaperone GrpE
MALTMTKHEEHKSKTGSEGHEPEKTRTGDASGEMVSLSREEHDELLRKANEFAALQDRLLRSAADFENAKKRLAKERDEFLKFALEDFIYDLLPMLDHFELALSHLNPEDEKMKSMRDGFLLIQRQFLTVLATRGLKRIETVGKPFDPHYHESMGHAVSKEHAEGTILEELLAGYELNGKLLRPAKVKISTREETKSSEEKNEELT